MIAFVVSVETMNRAVRAIGTCERTFAGIESAPTEIGRLLFRLNIEAVMLEYPACRDRRADIPGATAETAYPENYHFCGVPYCQPGEDLIDAFKALQCLLNQCHTAAVVMTPVFDELEQAVWRVGLDIVMDLPEYLAAPFKHLTRNANLHVVRTSAARMLGVSTHPTPNVRAQFRSAWPRLTSATARAHADCGA
jgi:hypothetical protein